jgi:hypothetical protein
LADSCTVLDMGSLEIHILCNAFLNLNLRQMDDDVVKLLAEMMSVVAPLVQMEDDKEWQKFIYKPSSLRQMLQDQHDTEQQILAISHGPIRGFLQGEVIALAMGPDGRSVSVEDFRAMAKAISDKYSERDRLLVLAVNDYNERFKTLAAQRGISAQELYQAINERMTAT